LGPTLTARYGRRTPELKQICRKHGPTLKAIAYYQRIQAELQELNAGEQSIAALEQHVS